MIYPSKLQKGDIIALVAPSSPISEADLQKCIQQVENMGYIPHYSHSVLSHTAYLAGTDEERAKDFMQHFENKEVKAVWAVRGGYGAARMAPYLDLEIIKKNPKMLIGYSDITFLLNYIYTRTGLITFHGPVLRQVIPEFSSQEFSKTNHFLDSSELLHYTQGTHIYNPGKAQGTLFGGNLSVMCSMLGTKYEPTAPSIILFLEDVGEKPYRIDRMLTQILQSKMMKKVRGIILGQFTGCDAKDFNLSSNETYELKYVFHQKFLELRTPVWGNFQFGHIASQLTLAVGAYTKMNTQTQTLIQYNSPI